MSGNPTNAAVWGGADVLIAPVTATIPSTNGAFDMNREQEVVTASITNGDATVTAYPPRSSARWPAHARAYAGGYDCGRAACG